MPYLIEMAYCNLKIIQKAFLNFKFNTHTLFFII